MATFDVLAGRLTIDNAGFLSGLQAASAAAQRFADSLNRATRSAQEGIERLTKSIGALKSTVNSGGLFQGAQTSAMSAERATARLGKALDDTKTRLRAVQRAASDLGANPAAVRTLNQLEERAKRAAGAVGALKSRIDGLGPAPKGMPPEATEHGSGTKSDSSRLAKDLETSNRALESAGKAFGLLEKMTARASTWLREAGASIQRSSRIQEALASIGISATSASERMEQLRNRA